MTFTPTPPTKPGAYWWKQEGARERLLEVYKIGDGSLSVDFPERRAFNCNVHRICGEWSSRLVPVEEVEMAFIEGQKGIRWYLSRARKIVEGEIEP